MSHKAKPAVHIANTICKESNSRNTTNNEIEAPMGRNIACTWVMKNTLSLLLLQRYSPTIILYIYILIILLFITYLHINIYINHE